MMELIIGKEGNQAFEIHNGCVSRKHAKLTITDDGRWILEDLNSKNGTFIQNADGEFVQVKCVTIDEYTRIALGSTTATGCFFYAHHVLEPGGSYGMEMRHVLDRYAELVREKEMIEKADSRQNMVVRFIPPIISAVVTVIILSYFPEQSRFITIVGSLTTLLMTVTSLYQQKNTKAIKLLKEKQSRLIRCPKCNRPLSLTEISNEQCAACKVHS